MRSLLSLTHLGEIHQTIHQNLERKMAKKKKWIQKAKIKKGALHKDLGVPMGKKIPKAKLDAAAKKGGKIGRRARLAKTFAKMRRKKK